MLLWQNCSRDLEIQISSWEVAYTDQVNGSQPLIDGFDGLMARISALDELPWFPSFFIFLLFLAIETSPIIVKLLSPRGPYDYKLEDEESAVKTWASQKVEQRKLLFNTDTALNKQVYDDLSKEEEMYRYKKKKAEELLKLQADAFHKLQIKNL